MGKTIRDLSLLSFFTLAITFFVWLPHLLSIPNFYGLNFSAGFNNIYRNYDGLEYVVIAKSFYKPALLAAVPQSNKPAYYPAHFPGFSLLIALFSPLLGYLKSMLVVSILFTVLSALIFYLLVRDFKLTRQPLLLSTFFLLLPARWLVVHSVGSAEPMFIFFVLLTIYGLLKYELKNHWRWMLLTVVGGIGSQLTRPPGILLFVALVFYITWRHRLNIGSYLKYLPLIFIPLTLFAIFGYFQYSLGDFWAYFHTGDNIHLTFPPFQVFNKFQFWVGEIWLEDLIYIFTLGLLGGLLLFKQKLHILAFFVLTYLGATILVAHRDIARYSLPIFPFLLIAFEKILVSREFKIVMVVVALAIYLYGQNFILNNTAPIANIELLD